MTKVTYYMYPCDTCCMISEKKGDEWLRLSYTSKRPFKSNYRTKGELSKKNKNKTSSSPFGYWKTCSEGGEPVLERESETSL